MQKDFHIALDSTERTILPIERENHVQSAAFRLQYYGWLRKYETKVRICLVPQLQMPQPCAATMPDWQQRDGV
jgi:hypothetical protein